MIGICGHVGSGKTTLLLAALGQLRLISGQVTRDGSCAYVSQEPWILNDTLKENVLFGEYFDSKRLETFTLIILKLITSVKLFKYNFFKLKKKHCCKIIFFFL